MMTLTTASTTDLTPGLAVSTALARLRPGEWTYDAACTVGDWERLDPITGGEPTRSELHERTEAATALCVRCPVIRNCAMTGDLHAEQGVWGGSLRYRAGGPRGEYVVIPLIPEAVPSVHEREVR